MSWPVVAGVVIIAILVVILIAQRGTTVVSAPASALPNVDEAQLATLEFPGSTIVPQIEAGLRDGTAGSTNTTSRALWTEAEPEQVRTWFRDWMTSHGWKADRTSAEISALVSKEAIRLKTDQTDGLAGLMMDGFMRGKARFTLMVFPVTGDSLLSKAELPATARTLYSTTYASRRR
jgi:hypothetical protein